MTGAKAGRMVFALPVKQTTRIDHLKDAVNLPDLIALSDYTAPTMPTERAFRSAWARLKRRLSGPEDPLLHNSVLDPTSLGVINDLAAAPDCAPLLQALDQQFGEGSREAGAGAHPRLRTLIVPPCDTGGTLALWAKTRGHELLCEPDRLGLIAAASNDMLPDLSGDGLLVIPRLEHWFLRERNGLHVLRSLLSQLAGTERRCLVGCDSWAWRFMVKAANADLSLPPPQTFAPFDARRLCDWFTTLARDSDSVTATFRLTGNGDDVLACDSDGEPLNGHLRELAARSGGNPWVAWHLWRAGMKVSDRKESLSDRAAKAIAADARTVWVVGVNDVDLPSSNEDRALLVLQALLIHGALTPDELNAVLPTTGEPNMLAALVASDHLRHDRSSGCYRVKPTAYPAIRNALKAAGIPTGVM